MDEENIREKVRERLLSLGISAVTERTEKDIIESIKKKITYKENNYYFVILLLNYVAIMVISIAITSLFCNTFF